MPAIVALVEGEGDQLALPTLITRLRDHLEAWEWYAGDCIPVLSLAKLRRGLPTYLHHTSRKQDCGAILILLDLDEGCPKDEARSLGADVRALQLPQPVAIVLAHREYEAWFLASLHTIAPPSDEMPADLHYVGDVEARRGAKEWLSKHMLHDQIYRPTTHQKQMTALLDLEATAARARSFRRLLHALGQLMSTPQPPRGTVSPPP